MSSKQIVPVTCVAKTSKDTKALWEAKGLKIEECIEKLQYEFLAGLEDTATGVEIKNKITECANFIAGLLESKLKVESRKELYVNAVSFWQDTAVKSMFGKTILADAKREMSQLPFAVKAVAGKTEDNDGEEVVSEEL